MVGGGGGGRVRLGMESMDFSSVDFNVYCACSLVDGLMSMKASVVRNLSNPVSVISLIMPLIAPLTNPDID